MSQPRMPLKPKHKPNDQLVGSSHSLPPPLSLAFFAAVVAEPGVTRFTGLFNNGGVTDDCEEGEDVPAEVATSLPLDTLHSSLATETVF